MENQEISLNTEFKIFYSWQSDLKGEANHYFIRDALKSALKKLNAPENNLSLRIDTATEGLSGSPNIEQAIFKKINESTVFFADITIINANQDSFRKTPNPNVLIELGYAIHRLGWNKIVLVHNNYYGKVEDLPFDIRNHRVSQYNFDNINNKEKQMRILEDICYTAIKATLSLTNKFTDTISLEEKERLFRERDVRLITKILTTINTQVIDNFLECAKNDIIINKIFFFWEGFHCCVKSSNFYLYNKKIEELIIDFYTYWEAILSYGEQHCIPIDGQTHKFTSPYNPCSQSVQQQWDIDYSNFHKAIDSTENAFRNLVKFIQETYLEIDIEDTNRIAIKLYNSARNDH